MSDKITQAEFSKRVQEAMREAAASLPPGAILATLECLKLDLYMSMRQKTELMKREMDAAVRHVIDNNPQILPFPKA